MWRASWVSDILAVQQMVTGGMGSYVVERELTGKGLVSAYIWERRNGIGLFGLKGGLLCLFCIREAKTWSIVTSVDHGSPAQWARAARGSAAAHGAGGPHSMRRAWGRITLPRRVGTGVDSLGDQATLYLSIPCVRSKQKRKSPIFIIEFIFQSASGHQFIWEGITA